MVAGDIRWFQVVCCFSSYSNFTTYTRVISLLYSWTQVINWGHSIFYWKQDSKKKIIVVLLPSRLKKKWLFPIFYCVISYTIISYRHTIKSGPGTRDPSGTMSDKKLFLKEIKKKQSQNTKKVEYCELFETRSFSGEYLKFFLKQRDHSHSRGNGENWTKMGRSPRRMERDGRPVK